jgi:hypothetical protein
VSAGADIRLNRSARVIVFFMLGAYTLAAGCLASLALYVLVAILLIPDGAPFLVVATFLVGVIVVANRWLRSDWPLY